MKVTSITKAKLTLLGLLGLGFATFAVPVRAADVTVFWQCSSTSASGVTTYGQCPASVSNPLPVTQTQLTYVPAPGNTTTTQLAASATFNGTIDGIVNEQVVSLNMTSDQPVTLTVHQYIDAAGTFELPQIVATVAANVGFNQSYLINGNYVKISAQNTGGSTTTTFNLNTYYGPSQVPTGLGGLAAVVLPTTDPCGTSGVAKSSVVVSLSSAATTALVAVSGTKAVYVCGFAVTIAPSATSADTVTFEYGTGVACAGSPTVLTGAFGAGDLTSAAPPATVAYGGGGATVMTAPSANGLCAVSAGTAVSVQGLLSYVQQ